MSDRLGSRLVAYQPASYLNSHSVATEWIIHFVHHSPSVATEVKHKPPLSRIAVSLEYQ
jgi:hypothetical protein